MKKNDELLRIIGDIDDDMIEKAEPDRTKRKKIVWTGIASTAALIAVVAGFQYQFFIRPLMKSPDSADSDTSVTSVSEMISDDISAADGCKILKVTPEENNYSEILSRKLLPSENGNINILQNGTEESVYTGIVYNGVDYDFNQMMYGNTNSGPVNGTVTENHIFVLFRGALYSADTNNHVYYCIGNSSEEDRKFYGEMDSSGNTYFLGADKSENVYILNDEYNDNKYRLMKFSPELELISDKYIENVRDDEFPMVPYKPVFDSASGFDSIDISERYLNIYYGDNYVMQYNLVSGFYESDGEFVTEEKERDDENGIYRSGDYITAYDEAGNAALKINIYTDTEREGNLVNRICYTDGCIEVYCKTKETQMRKNITFDTEGNIISSEKETKEYSDEEIEFSDVNFYPDRKMLSDFNAGICVLYDTGFSVSDVPEGKYIKYARRADDGSVLCCMSENAESDISVLAVVSRTGEYREITDERVINHIKNGVFYPSPQYDGTFAYIADGKLYSYNTHTDTLSAVCSIDENDYYSMPTDFIEKINDKVYCLPPSAYDSDTRVFYILNVE